MNKAVNDLQLYKTKWHAGLTEMNHLKSAFVAKPHVVSTMVSRLLGRTGMQPLQYLTDGMGRKEEIGDVEYEWYLEGDDEKPIRIAANLGDGGATPGIQGTTFRVVLEERWFVGGDILLPDDTSRRFQVRVTRDPESYGGNQWMYTLEMITPDPLAFMPLDLIQPGKQFSKEYSASGEDGKPSHTTFSFPFKMRNFLTTLFKEYSVTRSAATEVMCIAVNGPNGESTTMWTRYAEWKYMVQYYMELERMYWFGRYNRTAQGNVRHVQANNRPIYMGAGIWEQISKSNRREYTTLTKDVVLDFLIDLSYNVLDNSDRHFVAFTGEFGFVEFDRAMREDAAQYTLMPSNTFIGGSGQEMILQGQFVQYKGPNGITLTLKKLPLYDNITTERQMHWKSGRPITSYRFTILDFGRKDGKSNITKVYKKDSEQIMWHTAGSVDPMGRPGKSSNEMRSNGRDGYSVYCLSESGIRIDNPTSCGELICTATK
jgi:hypothetical protein